LRKIPGFYKFYCRKSDYYTLINEMILKNPSVYSEELSLVITSLFVESPLCLCNILYLTGSLKFNVLAASQSMWNYYVQEYWATYD